METVWIKHPKLPDNPPAEVAASALQEHQRGGWEQTDPPPPPPLPEPDPGPDDDPPDKTADQTSEAPADAGASALPDESPRRRRTTSTTRGDE